MMRLCVIAALLLAGGNKAAQEACTITLDPSRPGPALSPYLYGQFIEHLGRCIRDGIWAEKLRDRKFLLEPGKSWDIVNPDGADLKVFHDPAGAYAGDHALAVWLRGKEAGRGGVRQGKIGLVAGKEYVGYAVLAHAGRKVPVEIRLAWGERPEEGRTITLSDIPREHRKLPFRFRAGATTESASLSITLPEPGYLWIGCVSLMPSDHTEGMRADVLPLIRKLSAPIIRWPGGNFVSGYDWKDGIGDRDRRPPRWSRAWKEVEDNDFGIDEFMAFCKAIGAEPYVAVNTGLGSVSGAANLVEYANGAATTRWGAERAKNGHPDPYHVVWWGVGNEMYGSWQLGRIPVERYAIRHNAFARAMFRRDPRLKLIGVGHPGRWNDVLLPRCAESMVLLSAHHYTQRKRSLPFSTEEARKYEAEFPAYSGRLASGIRRLVEDLRKRRGKGNPAIDRIRLAIDEWGIVRDFKPEPDGPGHSTFEHYFCLGDALAVARGLHEILRSGDLVFMANWAQTVNVVGVVKTSPNDAVLDPVGHVLALYRGHLTGSLVPLSIRGDARVDAVATRDGKSGTISVALVNFSPGRKARVTLRFSESREETRAKGWRIQGPRLDAINLPGRPEAVTTNRLPGAFALDEPIVLPARSITILDVPAGR